MRTLVAELMEFTHVFVICGCNDVNSSVAQDILRNYEQLIRNLHPRVVRISGILPRGDITKKTRKSYNLLFTQRLGQRYKSPKLVSEKDFDASSREPYHFYDDLGKRHFMQLVLSFLTDSFGSFL